MGNSDVDDFPVEFEVRIKRSELDALQQIAKHRGLSVKYLVRNVLQQHIFFMKQRRNQTEPRPQTDEPRSGLDRFLSTTAEGSHQ